MNLIKRSLLVMACSVAVGLNQSAVASEATAFLDWSKLQVSVIGIEGTAPTVTFSGQNTNLNSSASIPDQITENNTVSIFNWTSTADTNAQAGATTFANTLASPLTLSGNVQATGAMGNAPFFQPIQVSSSGSRSESFFFDGPGVLTVSIPYTISIMGGEPFNFFDSTSASVHGGASFSSLGNNGSFNSSSDASFLLESLSGLSPQSQSGSLVFGIVASGPGTGSLSVGFNVTAQVPVSPIPEPESYAMLLAGLGLMGAIVRRRTMEIAERIG